MRIGPETNARNNELHMQSLYETYLLKMGPGIIFKREVRVNEVSRIADFLILKGNQLINVELKTNPSMILLDQIVDHSIYCDYSFVLIPDFCSIPKWFIKKLYEKGIGSITFNHKHEIFTETLPSFYNKGRNRKIRDKYKELIKTHD